MKEEHSEEERMSAFLRLVAQCKHLSQLGPGLLFGANRLPVATTLLRATHNIRRHSFRNDWNKFVFGICFNFHVLSSVFGLLKLAKTAKRSR